MALARPYGQGLRVNSGGHVGNDQRGRRATLVDVARLAGVSRATAARALGDYGPTSGTTREAVRRAARELGYRTDAVARGMRTGSTSTIGVVVADISNEFFAVGTRGISDVARAGGYEVVVVNTDEDLDAEVAGVRLLLDKRIDGLVVAPASAGDAPGPRSGSAP